MKYKFKSFGFVLMVVVSIFLTAGCDNSSSKADSQPDPMAPPNLPEDVGSKEDAPMQTIDELDLIAAYNNDNYNTDYSSEPGKAKLGERCVSPALITVMEGVCQEPTDSCPGGYPDAFNLKFLMPPIPFLPAPGVGHMPNPPDPAGTCESGLKCCVDTDWGEKLAIEVGTYPILGDIVENIECADTGTCKSFRKREMLELGCPEGQSCCVEVKTLWEIIAVLLD